MKDENKKLYDMNILLNTKLNKFQMQKELLSMDIDKDINNLALLLNKKKATNTSFNDTLKEQMNSTRKYKLVSKCAYKWLYTVRKKINERINNPTNIDF